MVSIDFIFSILILIMSVVIHEVSHGYAAEKLGDPTAKLQGRLTLNPISHLDFFGSFLIPITSYLLGGFIFGWAKPVPYNPYNLRSAKWGEAMVAAAGPLVNILIAVLFGIIIRIAVSLGAPASFVSISALVVFVNIILAIFNLIPIPPLDGSKILFAILPISLRKYMYILEQFGFIFVIIFIFLLWDKFLPVLGILFSLLTGIGL